MNTVTADGGPAFSNLGISSRANAPVTTGENLVCFYPAPRAKGSQ